MLWLAPAGLQGGLKLEAYHQSRQPQYFSLSPRCSGTSVLSTRGVAASHLTRFRGSRIFVHVAAATSASCLGSSQQNITLQMFVQLQTLRRHVSRPVAAGVSLSAVHIFSRMRCVRLLLERLPRRRCQVVSLSSKLSSKVEVPPSCCRGNFHSFFMTLFTGRGRHHSSSRAGGAWGQCCHVEQLRLQPSWDISLWPSSLLWASLCFVSPFAFQLWRKEERPFVIGDALPDFTRALPWPLVSLHPLLSVAVRFHMEFTMT